MLPIKTIKPEVLEKARDLYLSGLPITEIADYTGIQIPALRRLAFGSDGTGSSSDSWLAQKGIDGPAIAKYESIRPEILTAVQARLMKQILSSSSDIEIEDLSDLEKAVSITEKLNKMERLEKDESTEIIDLQTGGMTLREIMESQHSDIDAEFKEVGE